MASAAGLPCDIDPALCAALRSQKTGKIEFTFVGSCLWTPLCTVSIGVNCVLVLSS